MKPRRLATLLVGNALAEGTSVGDTLREAGLPGALGAAQEAEAGRLGSALRRLYLGEELAVLAEEWPAAVRPADRRLSRIPPALVMLAPLIQALGYLLSIGFLQWVLLRMLATKVQPTLWMLNSDLGAARDHTWMLQLAEAVLIAVLLGTVVLGAITIGLALVGRLPGWGGHRQRAREAAVAASLDETAAPEEARRRVLAGFRLLHGGQGSTADLDRVFAAALTRADVAQRRLVSAVRAVGLVGLMLVALLTTAGLYLTIAQMPLAL